MMWPLRRGPGDFATQNRDHAPHSSPRIAYFDGVPHDGLPVGYVNRFDE